MGPDEHDRSAPISLKLIETAEEAMRRNPQIYGIVGNPDLVAPKKDGFMPATGALGKRMEGKSGRKMTWLGKPFSPIYELALSLPQMRGIPREQFLMLDDSTETGIRGANQMGMKSALVMTGNTTFEHLAEKKDFPSDDVPDFVLEGFHF